MKNRIEDIEIISLRFTNTFYINHGQDSVLIDTGLKGNAKKLFELPSIKNIIITHGHVDHLGNACELREKFGSEIFIHKEDADFLRMNREPGRDVAVDKRKFFEYETCGPDHEIVEGSKLPYKLKPIEVPGHTTGNLSILAKKSKYRDKGVLMTGDSLIEADGGLSLPLAKYSEDHEAAKNNLRKLLNYEFEKLIPGHGRGIYEKEDLKNLIREI